MFLFSPLPRGSYVLNKCHADVLALIAVALQCRDQREELKVKIDIIDQTTMG